MAIRETMHCPYEDVPDGRVLGSWGQGGGSILGGGGGASWGRGWLLSRFSPEPLSALTPTGYYRPSPTAEYTEDSPGGDFDFFSRLVSSWEAAAHIPGSPARSVVVRSGEKGHHACLGWLCFDAGARGGRAGRRTSGLVPVLVGVLFQSSRLRIVS